MKQKLFSVTLADCILQTFTVGGHGGSGKDTSNTGVRITHPPSGAVGEAREERSQLANKRAAWKRLANHPKMKEWIRIRAALLSGQLSVEQLVEDSMQPQNLRIEVKQGDKWVLESECK